MSENLELPVNWNNEQFLFPMEMVRWGYTHRFKVAVEGQAYFFEPDEEGIYRAIPEEPSGDQKHNLALLRIIGETLHELMQQ
jgi:hypothetical protein